MTKRGIKVLLLGEDENLRLWSHWLGADEFEVSLSPERGGPPEVMVADRRPQEKFAEWADDLAAGEVGLILLGADGPADVGLPADAAPRELRLACTLLAEIVRLRRQRSSTAKSDWRRLALTDPLTRLPNRRAWEEEVARRFARESADGADCLALFDVDHFKAINDKCGHQQGDAVLRALAKALSGNIRAHDFAARIGGDEFAVLLTDVDASLAPRLVERIRRGLVDRLTDQAFDATVSAGFACRAANAAYEQVFELADKALRRAKSTGRNRTSG